MLQLILAGILSLPGLLVIVLTIPIVAVLSTPAMALLVFRKPKSSTATSSSTSSSSSMDQRRVIVTGGSSGIGKAIAIEAAKEGVAQVVILARNLQRLEEARKEIQAANAQTNVLALSVDVSNAQALAKAADTIFSKTKNDDKNDIAIPFTHLFCCAGETHPDHFDKIPSETYATLTNINLLGSIYTSKAMLAHMKAGSITFCSSMAGQIGLYGYAPYCPSKFGVRGFAECLHVELCNNPDIHIQIAYPVDTNTPCFEKENETKPEETRLISEMAGLAEPADVGKTMLEEALKKNPSFSVYFSFDGFLVSTLTAGFGPVSTLLDAIAQVSIMSLVRWVSIFYLNDWYRMIRNYQNNRAAAAGKKTNEKSQTDEPTEASKLVKTSTDKSD